MVVFFWLSIFAIFYIYIGYPILIVIFSVFSNRPVQKYPISPFVSIIISAYNESEHICQTVQNKLDLNYPSDKFEIIVVSDGSTDGTDEIVRSLNSSQVRLIRQEVRAGKTVALNLAVSHAKGTIIVFSDANSIYDLDAIRKLVANFSDSDVGYVSGKMIYVNSDGSPVGDGCSAYMKYENCLRKYETKVGSIVGVDGGIDAVRKELYTPMDIGQIPDFVLPLKVIAEGYRVVYDAEALLKEDTLKQARDEYNMRVRVTLRSLWAILDMRHLLSIKKFGFFAFQLWSHKVLRYLCFLFLIFAFITNCFLLEEGIIYVIFLILHIFAILITFLLPFLERRSIDILPIRFINYFFLLNMACAHAFLKFISGKKQILWTPRKG